MLQDYDRIMDLDSVSKEIAASIIFVDFAAAMWKDLKDRFSRSNDQEFIN